ncbi:hypothetical protein DXG01_013492 [Tephrocybe rancida]|nr:hypothetical protein DXG01_013492 [Tephrocybe rancida]
MRNFPEGLGPAFRSFLTYNLPATYVWRKSPCPPLPHPLAFYDVHLDRRLCLKKVKLIPTFPITLSEATNLAFDRMTEDDVDLPPPVEGFPFPDQHEFLIDASDPPDAKAFGERYRASISFFACKIASMLTLHPTAATWSTAVVMAVRLTSRHQKYYNLNENYVLELLHSYDPLEKRLVMIEKDAWDALSDDDRTLLAEMKERFPKMAVWQIYYSSQEARNALKNIGHFFNMASFPEILPSTITDRPLANASLDPPPDAIDTSWGMSLATWIGPTEVDVETPRVACTTQQPVRRSIRSTRRRSDTGLITKTPDDKRSKREKKVKVQPPEPLAAEKVQTWPNVTIPAGKRDLTIIDEDMTTSVVQHAWTRAVERDSTFIVLHCGSSERIAFRHRASQTLFVSDMIQPRHCKEPAYGHMHIGLYISIINDLRDRTRQIISQEADLKPTKRKRGVQPPESNKRPRTRGRAAAEEALKLDHQRNFKAVCDGLADRDLALLRIQHGPYNSPVPSSFVRVDDARVTTKSDYKPHEYFCITITSEIASGSTGDAHAANIELPEHEGQTFSISDAVVKLAFDVSQQRRLRHEFLVYKRLMAADAQGVPYTFGLFEDVETATLALVMEYVGASLWDSRLLDKTNRLKVTISPSEKAGFLGALKSIHNAGVRHRDLRIENLTINRDGHPYIIDFDRADLEASETSRKNEYESFEGLLDGQYEISLSCQTPESEAKDWETDNETDE